MLIVAAENSHFGERNVKLQAIEADIYINNSIKSCTGVTNRVTTL